jgi:hypothetical protein
MLSDWKCANNALITGYKKNGMDQVATQFENNFIKQMKNDKSWTLLLQR